MARFLFRTVNRLSIAARNGASFAAGVQVARRDVDTSGYASVLLEESRLLMAATLVVTHRELAPIFPSQVENSIVHRLRLVALTNPG